MSDQTAKADAGKLCWQSLIPNGVRWKFVDGYGRDYVVCEDGTVISVKRNVVMRQKNTHGYMVVSLCNKGVYATCLVHRLVASAFCTGKSEENCCVNHKDENKTNNCAENLEWCSYRYNNNYGTARERAAKARARTVKQIFPDGTEVLHQSCTTASKKTGVSQGNIWGVCNGLWARAGGCRWEYV